MYWAYRYSRSSHEHGRDGSYRLYRIHGLDGSRGHGLKHWCDWLHGRDRMPRPHRGNGTARRNRPPRLSRYSRCSYKYRCDWPHWPRRHCEQHGCDGLDR